MLKREFDLIVTRRDDGVEVALFSNGQRVDPRDIHVVEIDAGRGWTQSEWEDDRGRIARHLGLSSSARAQALELHDRAHDPEFIHD